MSCLATFRRFKKWLTQSRRGKILGRNYIHLDGSPYEVRGVKRVLMSSALKKAAVSSLFLATGLTLLSPAEYQPMTFVYQMACGGLSSVAMATLAYLSDAITEDTFGGHVLLDKSGFRNSSPDETRLMIKDRLFSAACFGSLAAVGGAVIGWVGGLSYGVSTMAPMVIGAGWHFYTVRKLQKGDWTVRTSAPPFVKEPKRETVPFAKGAFVPVPY